jgi:hypothetical protein
VSTGGVTEVEPRPVVIDAVDTMRRCAAKLVLFSELPTPWPAA